MRRLPVLDTLVLDLDGTLVDTLADLAAALAPTLAGRGLAPLGAAEIRPLVGDGLAALVERAFALRGARADAAAIAAVGAAYESDPASRSVLYPGVADALADAGAAGFALAVCTNKPVHAARSLLSALGIGGVFAAVGGGDSFAVRKPDPGHLLMTLEQAGGTPSRAVMVGDHRNDILAASAAGVASIFALWGFCDAADGTGADAVAAGWPEIVPRARALLA